MTRVVAVVQARMTSTRLPGKVLLPLGDRPVLAHVVERLLSVGGIDHVQLAVPAGSEHDAIEHFALTYADVGVTRGSEADVLERTIDAALEASAEVVVRVTSDCPVVDPRVTGAVIAAHRASGVSYARTSIESGYPHGFDTEVISLDALLTAGKEARSSYEREHVTPFLWRQPERFPSLLVDHRPDLRHWRLVLDTPEDLALLRAVYDRLGAHPGFGLEELRALFSAEPSLLELNSGVTGTPYLWTEDGR